MTELLWMLLPGLDFVFQWDADGIGGVVLLGGIFLFFTGLNDSILYCGLVKHEKTSSMTPFIGGCAGALLVLILTNFKHLWLALIPLMLDPGCIPLVIRFVVYLIRDVLGGKKDKS